MASWSDFFKNRFGISNLEDSVPTELEQQLNTQTQAQPVQTQTQAQPVQTQAQPVQTQPVGNTELLSKIDELTAQVSELTNANALLALQGSGKEPQTVEEALYNAFKWEE